MRAEQETRFFFKKRDLIPTIKACGVPSLLLTPSPPAPGRRGRPGAHLPPSEELQRPPQAFSGAQGGSRSSARKGCERNPAWPARPPRPCLRRPSVPGPWAAPTGRRRLGKGHRSNVAPETWSVPGLLLPPEGLQVRASFLRTV